MAEIVTLAEAIAATVHDGDTIAIEGFTHLIPHAAGRFTGETLTAVSALRPDIAVIHGQRPDRAGNVQLWGITEVQKEAVLASSHSVVTTEEIVDSLEHRPGAIVLPGWCVTYVAEVPGGAHPSYALGYSARDNDYYLSWGEISRDRERFADWLEKNVFGSAAPAAQRRASQAAPASGAGC